MLSLASFTDNVVCAKYLLSFQEPGISGTVCPCDQPGTGFLQAFSSFPPTLPYVPFPLTDFAVYLSLQ